MSKTEKLNEEQVFRQEIADDELEAVSGGKGDRPIDYVLPSWCIPDDDSDHCTETWERNIYEGAFPNCASTVEDGSWCKASDACTAVSISYQGMTDCGKAWR